MMRMNQPRFCSSFERMLVMTIFFGGSTRPNRGRKAWRQTSLENRRARTRLKLVEDIRDGLETANVTELFLQAFHTQKVTHIGTGFDDPELNGLCGEVALEFIEHLGSSKIDVRHVGEIAEHHFHWL